MIVADVEWRTWSPIIINKFGLVLRVRLPVRRNAFHDAHGLHDELDDRGRIFHRLHDGDVGRIEGVQSVHGSLVDQDL